MATVGHLAVGLAIGRIASRRRRIWLLLACASAAAAADVDFVLGAVGHRGPTHSLAFAALLGVLGAMAAPAMSRDLSRLRVGVAVFVAAVSHTILDAMAGGPPVPILWPISDFEIQLGRLIPAWSPAVDSVGWLLIELLWAVPLAAWALWDRRPNAPRAT